MKLFRLTILICTIFSVVIFLTGCSNYNRDFFSDIDLPELPIAENITVTAEFDEYDKNVEKITLFVDNTGDEFVTGSEYLMQKFDNNEWKNVRVQGAFTAIQYGYEFGSSSYTASLKDHVKQPLPSGRYRIGIIGYTSPEQGDLIAFAEFTIK